MITYLQFTLGLITILQTESNFNFFIDEICLQLKNVFSPGKLEVWFALQPVLVFFLID